MTESGESTLFELCSYDVYKSSLFYELMSLCVRLKISDINMVYLLEMSLEW